MISLIGKMGIRAYRAPELSAPEIIEGGGRRVHIDEEGILAPGIVSRGDERTLAV